jgi:hypothetical protein
MSAQVNFRDEQALDRGEAAVGELIRACRKLGPLSAVNPKLVADVSRKAKWLRAALEKLARRREVPPGA